MEPVGLTQIPQQVIEPPLTVGGGGRGVPTAGLARSQRPWPLGCRPCDAETCRIATSSTAIQGTVQALEVLRRTDAVAVVIDAATLVR